MTFPVFPGSNPSGYNLTRSLRFRSSASAYLNRTNGTPTSATTWTWSAWVKRGTLGGIRSLTGAGQSSGTNYSQIIFNGDTLVVEEIGGSTNYSFQTTQVFRDPSSWYHIIVAVDTTQTTSTNRVKIYVNGVQVTAFVTATYPSLNYATYYNTSAYVKVLGNVWYNGAVGGNFFDGYQTEVNFIDGQALTPSSFGSTNTLTGVWQPARYTGTYGTNGFYLPFTDNSALTTSSNVGLGKDFSGNGNYWTTNNISITSGTTYDSMTDVPTLTSPTAANFAVLNPLDTNTTVPSDGNLKFNNATANHYGCRGTIALPTTGKWYFEMYIGAASGTMACTVGLVTASAPLTLSSGTGSYMHLTNATSWQVYANGATPLITGASAPAVGQYLQIAYDADNAKLWFGKNNTWADSSWGVTGNPSTGANATITNPLTPLFPFIEQYASFGVINFGQQPFAYTPPTNFVALNTYNLPTSTIVNGAKEMGILLYTGDGTTSKDVTGLSFQPDLTYVKNRSAASDPTFSDTLRGITKVLYTDATSAESTAPSFGYINSILSTGFNVNSGGGTEANFNKNGQNYVGWTWKAGQGTTSSNTAGTITSTVSVNANAGLSMVTYVGTGANATVGHGLGVAPKFLITKDRSGGGSWQVYHDSVGNSGGLYLNGTNAFTVGSGFWNNTSPTSSTISIGTNGEINTNGRNYIIYAFASIAGYSSFGSYVGNGSTDGPFVYLGFRPRFILMKVSSTAGYNWEMVDTTRNVYNAQDLVLYSNLSAAEDDYTSTHPFDFLSNGFKPRGTSVHNVSGATYIYAAFAENPFKNALAR